MLKFVTLGAIVLLILLRLAGTRLGARLLGVSQRVLAIVYLVALLVAGITAVATEQWTLLSVVGILLVISGVQELRRRLAGRDTVRTR